MVDNTTDFTKNDSFGTWQSSGDISSTTDFVMHTEGPYAQKRQHSLRNNKYGEPPAKKAALSIQVKTGFKWNLQVADMSFEGWGHSKREARACAARACLSALLARAGRVLRQNHTQHDFTSDDATVKPSDFQCLEAKYVKPEVVADKNDTKTQANATPSLPLSHAPAPAPGAPAPPPAQPPPAPLFSTPPSLAPHKSAINTLYETCPGVNFVCTYGDGSQLDSAQAPLQLSHSMRFKVVCHIKDQKFEGYGSSKKLAKLAAARCALGVLFERVEPAPGPCVKLPQTLADHVAKLINERFNELMKEDLNHAKRKVLAGIVITVNNRPENAKVIAVTTGTKCISGEHMSVRGMVVNDCHAEVAARRCLQRYLYAQLLMYAKASDPRLQIPGSDLEPVPSGGYRLRSDRQLHLYVSTAPCGDGRIFSPHDSGEPDKHPNRMARGQLRTKIESGEGTIPVKNCNNVVQTWDGVLQGERLLTMSCSDKVARWCVAGLQGALLSRVLYPVYLNSIVLGSLLHHQHLYRAVCGRVEATLACLPPPFRVQRPMLARAASAEARSPARAPSYCMSWCVTHPTPEIINATTGKLETGQPSLICKQSMYARWQYIVKRVPLVNQEPESGITQPPLPDSVDSLLYSEAKQLCSTYQAAKNRLIDAFDKANLGRWIKKPLEQDQFPCEIANADPSALFV